MNYYYRSISSGSIFHWINFLIFQLFKWYYSFSILGLIVPKQNWAQPVASRCVANLCGKFNANWFYVILYETMKCSELVTLHKPLCSINDSKQIVKRKFYFLWFVFGFLWRMLIAKEHVESSQTSAWKENRRNLCVLRRFKRIFNYYLSVMKAFH